MFGLPVAMLVAMLSATKTTETVTTITTAPRRWVSLTHKIISDTWGMRLLLPVASGEFTGENHDFWLLNLERREKVNSECQ